MNKEHEQLTISQWGALMRKGKCLIVHAANVDWWELPGGRIEVNELDEYAAEFAFRREIQEELGIAEFTIVSPVDWMIGYSLNSHAPICRVVYLIKNDDAEIKLSHEHSEYRWISLEEVDNYTYYEPKNAKKLSEIIKSVFVRNF